MCTVSKNIVRWKLELDKNDLAPEFIIECLRERFSITDWELNIGTSCRSNYRSTTQADIKMKVEETIRKELDFGRYFKCDNQPYIVSSLGAIVKPNKNIELIHHLSNPDGGVNRLAEIRESVIQLCMRLSD